ncbi:hypothetical protein QVN49_10935 [Megasphaera hexanoica]|nr:hypothetical protein [Megasphaera hexanoica]
MATTKKCFLCGRPMKQQEGLLYDLCTNPKCPRSKPLPAPEGKPEQEETE